MKTAMQELIKMVETKQVQSENEWQSGYQKALNDILFDAKNKLEKEKEQIIDAYRSGHSDRSFEKYNPNFFEENYNQNK